MSDAILLTLQSIDATLKEILSLSRTRTLKPPTVDLDGKHGDPTINAKDPKDWSGSPMKGRRFSECPPEYLELLAERFLYFASRESDAKKAGYNRLDAARATAWAARLRAGWKAPASAGDWAPEEMPKW